MGAHTIHQRRTLDQSNYTLRFNRTMKEAGMTGPIAAFERPFPKRIAIYMFAAMVACVMVMVVSTIVAWVR